MEIVASSSSSTTEATINRSPPCKIVDNIVIGDELPLYEERFGIGELLFEKLNSNPSFVGQIDSSTDKRMTFAEIKERSVRCALWLMSRGVKRGDVVGISTFNHSDSVIALLGCLFIGAYVYPNFEVDIHKCRCFISLLKPKIIFVNSKFAQTMANAVEKEDLNVELVTFTNVPEFQNFQRIIEKQDATAVDEFRCIPIINLDEIAVLIFSSGMKELSKVIMMSHRALINNMLCDNSFATNDQGIIMYFKTFRWLSSMIILLQSIYFYKTRIICWKYDDELMYQLIEKYKVQWMWLEISTAARIMRKKLLSKYNLSSLKKIVVGGAGMVRHLQKNLIKILPHTEVIFIYRMKEICGVNILQGKINSDGYTINNARLKVINVKGETLGPSVLGQLLWKSPHIMTGYYDNPQATKAVLDDDGWLHSGEFGFYDTNGQVYMRDRFTILGNKDSVCPSEIEDMLENHPAIREVGVVFVQNNTGTEYLVAFVSKMSGKKVTAEKLEKIVQDVFEDYKPFHFDVKFPRSLPHTKDGKIAYKELIKRAKFWVNRKKGIKKRKMGTN